MLRLRSKRIGSLLASSLPLSAPRNTTSFAPALSVKSGYLKVVANVEPLIRHHGAADQCWNRGLAIQWMRTVNDHSCLEGLPVCLFGLQRTEGFSDSRRRRC